MATTSRKRSTKKAAKKTVRKTAKKSAKKTAAPRRKPAKKKAARKTAAVATVDKLSASVKRLMLANLGLYGQVLDELQLQAARASKAINQARRNPSTTNQHLIKRGEQLADQIKDILQRSGAPATRQLEKQLADLKKAIAKLRRG